MQNLLKYAFFSGANFQESVRLAPRSRNHFEKIFKLDNIPYSYDNDFAKIILDKLMNIYLQSVKPLEDAYHFKDMGHHLMTGKKLQPCF